MPPPPSPEATTSDPRCVLRLLPELAKEKTKKTKNAAPKARQSKRVKIDAAAATKLQLKLKAATAGRPLEELLRRYDTSGDGSLDATELKQLIRDDLKVGNDVAQTDRVAEQRRSSNNRRTATSRCP